MIGQQDFLILSDDSDIYSHIKLFKNSKYRILYVKRDYIGYDALTSRINRLNELGISIYDVVLRRKVNNFFENVSYSELFEVNGESLIKKL